MKAPELLPPSDRCIAPGESDSKLEGIFLLCAHNRIFCRPPHGKKTGPQNVDFSDAE